MTTEAKKEIVKVANNDVSLPPVMEVTERIDTMLANRSHIIAQIKPILIEQVDVYTLPGMTKPSLGKPGAEKLAAVFGLRASFKVDEETKTMLGDVGRPFVGYVCTLTHNGEFAGEGRGAAFVEMERTQYKNMNAREFEIIKLTLNPSEYKTAQGQYGVYYRVKDGTVFDPLALNKSIKMAQKSAFVDAVIRTTGMSDLFTQDIEDVPAEAPINEGVPVTTPPVIPTPSVSNYQVNPPVNPPTDSVPLYAPVIQPVAPRGFSGFTGHATMKECPFCKKWHDGMYPKCYTCYRSGAVAPPPTKTIINPNVAPF